jgi:quinol-cytochrome oxidoreductase complex cytochrome b subunit
VLWWLGLIALTALIGAALIGFVLAINHSPDEWFVSPEEIYHEVDEAIGRVVDRVVKLAARMWAGFKTTRR